MKIDDRIIKELNRYNKINRYIIEQAGEIPAEEPPVEPAAEPTTPAAPTVPAEPTPIDASTDPDVEKIDSTGKSEETSEGGTEELDITDLVTSQKNVEAKQEEYFQNLFGHLEKLESKLAEMDSIVSKLNSLETKIEQMRPKTPQEKLELRSLDSYPYSQKLTDFFDDKQQDLQKTGKNEYVLTTDDVEEYSPMDIRKTFNDYNPEQLPTKY